MKPLPAKRSRKSNKKYQPARLAKPTIDPTVREAADILSRMTPKEIAEKSWVSRSAAYAILHGKTRRPQNLTIEGLLLAAGYTRPIIKRKP